jgi:serine/threonine protein kinase
MSNQYARKEFHAQGEDEQDYSIEMGNFIVLQHLKHPNILELKTCYTHGSKHNLIFPLAECDLNELLQSPSRPVNFSADATFFVALSGLASALCQMHNFTHATIEMLGCHRDLRPQNVLVMGSDFVLGDFGLSRFKDRAETSEVTFPGARGYCIAPECGTFLQDVQKRYITRSSDIWSFGCILAFVLTYMMRRKNGVEAFNVKREFYDQDLHQTCRDFHCGPDRENPGLRAWLEELDKEGNEDHRMLIRLIKAILVLKPESRPRAKKVFSILRYITLNALSQPLTTDLTTLSETSNRIDAFIEFLSFQSWQWALTTMIDTFYNDKSVEAGDDTSIMSFNQLCYILADIHNQIACLKHDALDHRQSLYHRLSQLTNLLLSQLPLEVQHAARQQVETQILISAKLSSMVNEYDFSHEGAAKKKIAELVAIKAARQKFENSDFL